MRSLKSLLGSYWLLIILTILVGLGVTGCQGGQQGPRARYGAVMVWDSDRDQMVLFGGRAKGLFGEKVLNDTWLFDLQDQTWRKLKTNSPPPPRLSPGAFLDPDSRQLVLFGGLGKDQRFGDTWVLDLESASWEEITPQNSPSPRSDMGLALDPGQRKALLFGGYCQEYQREKCAETWIYDLETTAWSIVHTTDSPPVTYGLVLIFDAGEGRFLQWGGHMAGQIGNTIQSLGYGDTLWSFSLTGDNWMTIPEKAGNTPGERYWHHLAYDPSHGEVILFGGNGGQGFLNDTWAYNSVLNQWRLVRSEESPPPRVNGGSALDEGRGQLILFGGLGEDFNVFRDTWVYTVSTSTWERLSP